MNTKLNQALVLGILAAGTLQADFTYQETSKVTGGAIVAMMKFAGAFSKDARRVNEPTTSTVAIQGNRMVRKNQLTATITDLDAETITTINFEKKTYYTMTFAQMKQAMDDAAQQMNKSKQENGTDVKFDVKVNDTGKTKNINGFPAREMIVTMTMEGTDQKSGAKGGMDITTDSWLAPEVAGYQEVRAFQRRMAEKLNWAPGGGLMNRPDIARGMSELYKEGAKLDGIPVLQVVRMGGAMEGMPQDGENQSKPAASSSSSSSSVPPTSLGGALGSALGGRFGLGRKKSQPQDQPADANANPSAPGSLMEMTIELTDYSSAPVDAGMFATPAGYKQIEPEAYGGRRTK